MELERSMRHGVVAVPLALIVGIRWDNMIDLIMAHHTFAQHDKPAEHCGDQDQDDDQVINCKARPGGDNRSVQPFGNLRVFLHSNFFYLNGIGVQISQ